ncbi:MAG: NAD-dependent epimerase/dehydratase family protein [Myxococcota bacterium]
MTSHASIHTIFGAGQVGTRLAAHLGASGLEVRLVRRSAPGPAIHGVTWMRGDITDAAFADRACRGASVVYNCANPADYSRWRGVLEPLYRAVWQAAGRARARVVQLDNLYMYGRPPRAPFDESTPEAPIRDKGRLRHELGCELLDMHARGEVEAVIGRASDFFGPKAPNTVVTRDEVLQAILAGGTAYVFGQPDQPHGYTYIPDVVSSLAILGAHPDAPGRVWFLPTSAKLSTRALLERFAEAAGTRVRVRGIPSWMLKMVGVFSPLMRALGEMAYQWEMPYVLDDSAFCRTFGASATPLDQAIDATLAEVRAA